MFKFESLCHSGSSLKSFTFDHYISVISLLGSLMMRPDSVVRSASLAVLVSSWKVEHMRAHICFQSEDCSPSLLGQTGSHHLLSWPVFLPLVVLGVFLFRDLLLFLQSMVHERGSHPIPMTFPGDHVFLATP